MIPSVSRAELVVWKARQMHTTLGGRRRKIQFAQRLDHDCESSGPLTLRVQRRPLEGRGGAGEIPVKESGQREGTMGLGEARVGGRGRGEFVGGTGTAQQETFGGATVKLGGVRRLGR